MSRWVTFRVATVAVVCALPAPARAAEDDIVLACAVRIAFYEKASPAIAKSMLTAIQSACLVKSSDIPAWYCQKRDLQFFRSVDVLGHKRLAGFACTGLTKLRFYPESMLEDESTCVALSYDASGKRHALVAQP
jgi:hypothetical protein